MALTRRTVLEAGVLFSLALPARGATSTVAIVPAARHPTLAAAVAAAIDAAGGLAFARDASVLLKPAVNSTNRYPATTDPETVLAVARLVLEAGGRPFVADRTMFLRSTQTAFEKTGILEAAREAKIDCVALEDTPVVAVPHRLATSWPGGEVPLYQRAVEARHVVNLCTPRAHKLGDLTMAIKNNVGLVAGGSRARMHLGSGFKGRLAEISLVARPSMVVLDARMGFADGGPDEGALVRPGLIVAGTDPLAVDAVGVAILRMHGANERLSSGSIWDIPMLRRAAGIGLGATGPAAIRLIGPDDAVAPVKARLA